MNEPNQTMCAPVTVDFREHQGMKGWLTVTLGSRWEANLHLPSFPMPEKGEDLEQAHLPLALYVMGSLTADLWDGVFLTVEGRSPGRDFRNVLLALRPISERLTLDILRREYLGIQVDVEAVMREGWPAPPLKVALGCES